MQQAIPRAKVNHDTGMTGLIAVICMIIDHVGVVFYPGQIWMRVVGRIAFPLFAWGIVVGMQHTRNIPRYALRLLIMLLISQTFFNYALNHTWADKLNIFATLLLGLLSIWSLQERKEWMVGILLMIAQLIGADYGVRGVLCILLLWACRDNPLTLSLCFSVFCVIWGQNSSAVWSMGRLVIRLQTAAILALPLMLIPRAKRTPVPRLLMYASYPGHLAVIWAIKAFLR